MDSRLQDTISLTTDSPEQTQSVGKILGAHAHAGDVFLLQGELGAGKTCLTQGILWGLGGEEYARSPTFVLICEYPARLTLYHMDLYRLDSADEIIELGLDDYFLGEGVCVVEWAEKVADTFIGEHLTVRIEDAGAEARTLVFSADSARYSAIMGALRDLSEGDADIDGNTLQLQSPADEAQ